MKRIIKTKKKGSRTVDGAGVSLVRVLGHHTVHEFDPVLMLDSFDSTDPKEYTAGFPMHPHRGIETISYLSRGNMVHRDTLGNEEAISDGEVQWMNAGSGILHEERVPAAERLLGVQLWLNLPAGEKMSKPTYTGIKREKIPEIELEGGKLRLLAGEYQNHQGFRGEHLPLNYYDIQLDPGARITLNMQTEESVMIFTLLGDIEIEGEPVEEKTAAKLTQGDQLTIQNGQKHAQILYIASRALNEPVAWAGPIVMNTEQELQTAFSELENQTFVKDSPSIQE
ncbi:pirin family protein [Peptoniphilaceae bacterium SGI.137]|nr:pirin family protein [Peptoniphilaceae bacterium]